MAVTLPEAYTVGAAVLLRDSVGNLQKGVIAKRTATQVTAKFGTVQRRFLASWSTISTGMLVEYGSADSRHGARLMLADSPEAEHSREALARKLFDQRFSKAAEAVAKRGRTMADVKALQALLPAWVERELEDAARAAEAEAELRAKYGDL